MFTRKHRFVWFFTDNAPTEGGSGAPAPEQPEEQSAPVPTPRDVADKTEKTPEPDDADPEPGETAEQRTIRKLREENAARRVSNKKLLATVAEALGLDTKPASEDELRTELTNTRATADQTAREYAAYRLALKEGVDADALLDSVRFTRALADLDPADTDAIQQAIRDAKTNNPALAAPQAGAARSGVELPPAGSGISPNHADSLTLEQAISAAYKN